MKVTPELQKMLAKLKTPNCIELSQLAKKRIRLEDIERNPIYALSSPICYSEDEHETTMEILKHGFYPLENIFEYEIRNKGDYAWQNWDIFSSSDQVYMDDFRLGGSLAFTRDGYSMNFEIEIIHNETTLTQLTFSCNITEIFDHKKIDVIRDGSGGYNEYRSLFYDIDVFRDTYDIVKLQDYIDAMAAWPTYVKRMFDFYEQHIEDQFKIFSEFPASKKFHGRGSYTVKKYRQDLTYVKLCFEQYRREHEQDVINLKFENDDYEGVINDWWIENGFDPYGESVSPRYPDAHYKAYGRYPRN